MEDRLNLSRQRRQRRQEYKELAAKSCYSLLIVMIALAVLRPLMVDQILSRADAYSALGRLDESKRQCDKALLIDDNSSRAWCLLARIYKTGATARWPTRPTTRPCWPTGRTARPISSWG